MGRSEDYLLTDESLELLSSLWIFVLSLYATL